jgi:hypothetical protein
VRKPPEVTVAGATVSYSVRAETVAYRWFEGTTHTHPPMPLIAPPDCGQHLADAGAQLAGPYFRVFLDEKLGNIGLQIE